MAARAGLPAPLAVSGLRRGERLEAPGGLIARDAHLVDCDLSGQRIPRFIASGSLFERCDFRRSTLVANLSARPRTTYRDVDFSRADLRRASPASGRFERCLFDHARVDRWFATQADFVDCRFAGPIASVRFSGTVSPPEVAKAVGARELEFVGNDFSAAELTDVAFVGGIDVGRQRWPDDPDYAVITNLPAGLDAAEAAVGTWPAGDDRRVGLERLGWLRTLFVGQAGQVRRRGQADALHERLWHLIEEGSEAAAS